MLINNILVVDDDESICKIVSLILNNLGYKTYVSTNIEDAISILKVFKIDLTILDYNLENVTADDFLDQLNFNIEFIILSGSDDISTAIKMMKRGAIDFVIKDSDLEHTLPQIMNRIQREKSVAKHLESTEIQLELTKTYLKDLINSISYAIIGIDSGLNIVHVNNVARMVFQDKKIDIVGNNLTSVVSCDHSIYVAIKKSILSETKLEIQNIMLNDGKHFSLKLFKIKPEKNKYVIVMEDITGKEKMMELFLQSEKMASLGKLSTSIAHEINNPLGGILQGVQLIKQRIYGNVSKNRVAAEKYNVNLDDIHKFLDDRDINKYLDVIYNGGSKVAKIIESIISFSKIDEKELESHNMNDIVNETMSLMRSSSDIVMLTHFEHIEFKVNFDGERNVIKCNISEMMQVILNLIKNSIQSFAGLNRDIKKIELSVKKIKEFVVLKITDNGCGIEKDNLQKISEPFFTTLDVGKGEGLGLSMVYYIITRNHNGYIEINSTLGIGTEILVQIPFIK